MKIIVPSVEILRTGLETNPMRPEQLIEIVGRTCYKSEDKITEDSAAPFTARFITWGHESVLEHWNVIYRFAGDSECDYSALREMLDYISDISGRRFFLRYTRERTDNDDIRCVVSGNMRAWRDVCKACMTHGTGNIPEPLHRVIREYPLFFPEYQEYITNYDPVFGMWDPLIPVSVSDLSPFERGVHQRITMRITCDRGVSHELVRHRVFSFSQESTRYCNYSQDKFGNEIAVIRPSDWERDSDIYNIWRDGQLRSEDSYFDMLENGAVPQQARRGLSNSLKTEVIMTGSLNDWQEFFDLRTPKAAHPDMREIAFMAEDLLAREIGEDSDAN